MIARLSRLPAILFVLIGSISSAYSQENFTATVNTVTVDGHGGPAVENGTILIRDGLIDAVGTDLQVPQGIKGN